MKESIHRVPCLLYAGGWRSLTVVNDLQMIKIVPLEKMAALMVRFNGIDPCWGPPSPTTLQAPFPNLHVLPILKLAPPCIMVLFYQCSCPISFVGLQQLGQHSWQSHILTYPATGDHCPIRINIYGAKKFKRVPYCIVEGQHGFQICKG